MAVTGVLQGYGYKVISALSGREAMEIVERTPEVDLVLMDIDLGKGMDGTEAAMRILEIRSVPIVFLSSHTEKEIVERTEKITSYGYVVKNSGDTVLAASIKMAFKLFDAYHAVNRKNDELLTKNIELIGLRKEATENSRLLRETEERFRSLVENSPEAIVVQTEGKIVYVNPAMVRLFAASSADDLLGLNALDLFPSEYHETVHRRIHLLNSERKKIPEMEAVIRCLDGSERDIEMQAVPVRYKGKNGSIGFYRDITGQKTAMKKLETERLHFEHLFNNAPAAIAIVDGEDRILNCNKEFSRLFQFTAGEALGRNIDDLIVPPHLKSEGKALLQSTREGIAVYRETQRQRKDGTLVPVAITSNPVQTGSQGVAYSMYQDISVRMDAERKVSDLLEEKELLLREVHHRLKNNMNTLTSLISLHRDRLADETALSALKDLEGNLRSMGILYDKLYCAKDLRAMSVKEYLPDLVDEILELFPNRTSVTRETRIDDFVLDVKALSTLSIILNELLTNSMKHAFGGRIAGIIRVTASKRNDIVSIAFEDDGVGLPDPIDSDNPGGFGLELVGLMIRQLAGTVRIERNNGTRFILEFPAREQPAESAG